MLDLNHWLSAFWSTLQWVDHTFPVLAAVAQRLLFIGENAIDNAKDIMDKQSKVEVGCFS